MGDIILNVFSLVDKRLNRLKGLQKKTKNDLGLILPQYEKLNEILNNAKKLLLKDPGDINLIQQNIIQLEIRLKIVDSEKTLLNNRLTSGDYEEEMSLLPPPLPKLQQEQQSIFTNSALTTPLSTSLPTSLPISPRSPLTISNLTSAIGNGHITPRKSPRGVDTTPLLNGADPTQSSKSPREQVPVKDDLNSTDTTFGVSSESVNLAKEEVGLKEKENNDSEAVSQTSPPSILVTTQKSEKKNFKNSNRQSIRINTKELQENFKNQEIQEKLNSSNNSCGGSSSSSSSSPLDPNNINNSKLEESQQPLEQAKINPISTIGGDNTLLPQISEEDLQNSNTNNNTTSTTDLSVSSEHNHSSLTSASSSIPIPKSSPLPLPQASLIEQQSKNPIASGFNESANQQNQNLFKAKLEIEEDRLNNTLMSSSLVDTFLLKHKGRSGSDLSISQFIQPFIMSSESQIQSPSMFQVSNRPSTPLSSSSVQSQQKITEKMKLANIFIRKGSDAKIGHARSSSQAKINYVPTDEELLMQEYGSSASSHHHHHNRHHQNILSSSTPLRFGSHKSMFLNTSPQPPQSSAASTNMHTSVNFSSEASKLNESSMSNGSPVGQGERLALLQSLLKSEELTNNAERKVIDEINNRTRMKTQELQQLVWEVRHLDKAIAHILNNRLKISDLTGISLTNPTPTPPTPRSPPSKKDKRDKSSEKVNIDESKQSNGSPVISYYQKENGSAVIELSSSLKYSLERLVVLLRTEPSILRDTLYRADYLGVELDNSFKASHTDLSQAIVFSLFGNCFTATDEKLLLLLIKSITELEFKNWKDKKTFGTHEPFSFTLLSTYLNYTYGKPYIISVLKDLVVAVIQDHNINLENDPQKKAMLAQIGILEEPEIDQNLLLQQFTGELLKRIVALSSGIPYALRWMSKIIIELWREHLRSTRPENYQPSEISIQKDKFDEREFIIHLIFENFFIPALIKPDNCGVLTGLTISQKARHNLIQIANLLLDFIRNPQNIPGWIRGYFGDMDRVLDDYFTELIQVEDPETYYHRPIFELELGQDLLVSSTDLFIILELIFHNHPDSSIHTPDENISLQKEVVEMIKKVQPASQLQEGMKFLIINVLPKNNNSLENPAKSLDPSIRLAKENLILALSVLSFLCGYSSSVNICELLLLQCGRSRSLELNILEAQIEETIRSLWALPDHYKHNDFQLLLDSMFDDYYKRERKRSLEKQLKVLYLDQLQRHTSQITSQRNIGVEFLTNQKFRLFRDKIYNRMQAEFVSDFMTRFAAHTGECDCEPTLDGSIPCKICTQKSLAIREFLQKSKNTMVQSEFWSSASEDDLNFASNTLERNLLTQIYNFTFNVSKSDTQFSKELNEKFSNIDYTLLYIPEKYSNQAPWELAQQELKKINLYKSPHDKMKCIIDTWNIIFNYTKPLGESGPDDFLPIMGYVIIKSRPEHILSNIQYIQLYTQLNDDDEIWFMNLKSSVEIVKEVMRDLKSSGWRRGILSLTSQRMENMLKEMKKKEKQKIWRTSIVRLESSSPILQQLQEKKQPSNINSQL